MKDLSECRVLIVDDIKENVDILAAILGADFRLSVALNGERALRVVERAQPDLVLLDVVMPDMDGFEVCRRIRSIAAARETPVMFLSARDDVKDKAAGFEAGGNDYLTKPFDALEVKMRVRALLKAKCYNDAVREQYESELRVAHRIQMGLIHPDVQEAARGCGLDAWALLEPARQVGGDMYDLVPLPDGRVFVVVGDVSGKGVPAALFMAMTLTLLRLTARQGYAPGQALDRVNRELTLNNPSTMFVTLICAAVDAASGDVEFASAGHPPAILIAPDAPPRRLEGPGGIVLGIQPDAAYPAYSARLRRGDMMLLYTDGVTEAEDASGQLFGRERLLDALADARPRNARAAVETLRGAVAAFVGDAPPSDDLAILAAGRPQPF